MFAGHTLPDEGDVVDVVACTNKIHRALANNPLVTVPATIHHHPKVYPPSTACSAPFPTRYILPNLHQ